MSTSVKFATVINCMDGRTQIPAITYIKDKTGARFVDTITEAGPVGILAENRNKSLIDSIRNRVAISVEKHGSKDIFVLAHFDCAGNPKPEPVQREQLQQARKTVESWGFSAKVSTLWVGEDLRAVPAS